ncbi:uncharacterized protein LOC134196584 isoform X2 [Corticium candelabrum]|uniref:uncharacterized protein LOC134196584 isoform X2 n=1 Tax=Corticium candelabrum TaxID=121492 RepID=UPI002E269E6D|nr:uncharacterized protein LOC134196584 isoform X2 [Corticium candelabrum]
MSAVDPKWQSHMQPRYPGLIEGLRVSGTVLDHLYQSGLLDAEGRSTVDKVQSNTEQGRVRCLLELLERKPPGSFEKFCNVLDKVGYKHLAVMLRSESVSSDQTEIRVPSASSGVSLTAGVTDITDGNNRPIPPMLASQGWKYDVFLCHAGDDKKDFVYPLYKELKEKHGIVSFFDAESLPEGGMTQKLIAEAIIQSPLFVVILSHEFKGKPYPETEVKAAFEFDEDKSDSRKFDSRYKKIIPVFYKITATACSESTVTILKKLARIAGIRKKTDENDSSLVTRVAERIREHVEGQRDNGEIKVLPELSSVRAQIKRIFELD